MVRYQEIEDCVTHLERGLAWDDEEVQEWISREAADLGINPDVALEDLELRGLGSDFQSLLGLIRSR